MYDLLSDDRSTLVRFRNVCAFPLRSSYLGGRSPELSDFVERSFVSELLSATQTRDEFTRPCQMFLKVLDESWHTAWSREDEYTLHNFRSLRSGRSGVRTARVIANEAHAPDYIKYCPSPPPLLIRTSSNFTWDGGNETEPSATSTWYCASYPVLVVLYRLVVWARVVHLM